jgi:hypothetical protein
MLAGEQQKGLEKTMDHCLIIHYKSHMMSLRTEPETPQSEATVQQLQWQMWKNYATIEY